MRLVTFHTGSGGARAGVVVARGGADEVIDIAATDNGLPTDLLALLEAGPAALDRVRGVANGKAPGVPIDSVQLQAPITRPPKLLAAAANYQSHITESGAHEVDKSRIIPKLFIKPSSAIVDPGAALQLPSVSHTVDWELELAVVIGRRCRDVPLGDALGVVAGYSIINDVSARTMDWGLDDREPSDWNDFFDWLNGKWLDGFAPMGPWLLTADEVTDPQALQLELRVNGEVKQHASTRDMIFGVAELVSFASRFMTLEPGDVFATGTPSGVGDTTGTYLRSGDVMEGTIDGLGVLRTPVA
jgi:2-keto-4-pentenoate hydratase/2-oxohepta-3-ene-1,7-dioic acid hydratase in catechol pathway